MDISEYFMYVGREFSSTLKGHITFTFADKELLENDNGNAKYNSVNVNIGIAIINPFNLLCK